MPTPQEAIRARRRIRGTISRVAARVREMLRSRPASIVATVVTVLALAGLAAGVADVTLNHQLFTAAGRRPLLAATVPVWVAFLVAIGAVRLVPRRLAAVLVVAGGVAIALAALAGPPNTSTDSARYAWDGIVQDRGVSPYSHVPASDALAPYRTAWLFPDRSAAGHCPQERVHAIRSEPGDHPLCIAINRSHVPTIYPAAAELWFAGVRALVPTSAEYAPLQVAGAVLALGTTVLILAALVRRRLPVSWAALWAWCPLVATEGITNSHVDLLGASLLALGSLLVAHRMPLRGGLAIGAAVAAKLIPVVAAPPLLKRAPARVVAAAVVAFVVLTVPYVVVSGPSVVGFLPGYLKEEGYDDGSRFALISAVLPGDAAAIAGVVVIALAALAALAFADPARPWHAQVVLVGVVLLTASPRYPWYGLMLLPFVALADRPEWLAVVMALMFRQLHLALGDYRIALTLALVVVLAATAARHAPALAALPATLADRDARRALAARAVARVRGGADARVTADRG